MRPSLAFSLNLLTLTTILLLGGGLGAFFVIEQSHLLQHDLDRRVQLLGTHLAPDLAEAVRDRDLAGVDQRLLTTALDREIAYVLVKNREGDILAARWAAKVEGEIAEQAFPLQTPSLEHVDPFGIAEPPGSGQETGLLTIGINLSSLHAQQRHLLWRTIAAIATAALLTMLLGALALHLVLRDAIEPLLAGIRAIGAGDLSSRVTRRRRDEIGEIGQAFNQMAEQLSTTLVTQQQLVATVEQRTAELTESLEQQMLIQEELNAALFDAKSASRAKSEFLANMSHELRTPMNGIIGMAQLLEMTEITSEQREYLAALQLSAENLLAIISDILDLAKIEHGKMTLENKSFDLRATLDEITHVFAPRLKAKQLSYRVSVADEVPAQVNGDPLRLKQILLNLLDNAVKFTAAGGITLEVCGGEQPATDSRLRFSVTDTGIGIPPEQCDQIFAPFNQGDLSITKRYGGTGLGLSICRQLVDLMGGTIRLESRVGVGSTFLVELPFLAAGKGVEAPATEPVAAVATWPGRPLHILLAEDNEINLKLLSRLLQRQGHTLRCAADGKAALALTEQEPFDLIFMDIRMPVLNGDEATRIIRERERQSGGHTPIIALTAYAMNGDRERFLQHGFDGCVAKPFHAGDLYQEMQRCLSARDASGTDV